MFATSDALKAEITKLQPDDFVSRQILERTPFAFDGHDWIGWKTQLAEMLEVDPKDVVLTGSGAVGYSLNPNKDFKSFDENSDIDCGIISGHHFDLAWRYLREKQVHWHTLQKEQKEAISFHRKSYIFNGTIATDKILTLLPFGRDWNGALELMRQENPLNGRELNLRIYRDFQSLRHYQQRNISQIRDKLLSPLEIIEEIPVEDAPIEDAEQ